MCSQFDDIQHSQTQTLDAQRHFVNYRLHSPDAVAQDPELPNIQMFEEKREIDHPRLLGGLCFDFDDLFSPCHSCGVVYTP